ncbi:hypothetical protein MC7420_7822 [Coleofasciculus chthonoplastes PCC 7420]|uniref:Uncharacterized protein n=1 Tax=Coleofasciculus chthonoplastes PCC 7420 TaxID=118168 RepID=B4VJA9_9CYAN|nr:hypothetical protein MC7420_7822 [Coleofasciculus chthonoplastes PCC 7420]
MGFVGKNQVTFESRVGATRLHKVTLASTQLNRVALYSKIMKTQLGRRAGFVVQLLVTSCVSS